MAGFSQQSYLDQVLAEYMKQANWNPRQSPIQAQAQAKAQQATPQAAPQMLGRRGGGSAAAVSSVNVPQPNPMNQITQALMGQQQAPSNPMSQAPNPNTTQNLSNAQGAYNNTQTARFRGGILGLGEGIYDAMKEKGARTNLANAQQQFVDQQKLEEEAKQKEAQAKALQEARARGEAVRKAGLARGMSEDKLVGFENAAIADPKAFQEIMKQFGEEETRAPDKAAATKAADDLGLTGKAKEQFVRDVMIPKGTTVNVNSNKTPFETMTANLPKGHVFARPGEALRYSNGETDDISALETVNTADIGKRTEKAVDTIQSSGLVNLYTDSIRDVLDRGGLPATGTGAAAVSAVLQGLPGGKPLTEADVGKFEANTNQGEVRSLLIPIKSKIGLQTINQMRQMSETGGALGNVSNFEVQVVQAALARLDNFRSEEDLRSALDIVDAAFGRAAFLAQNGKDIETWAIKNNKDPVVEINKQLNNRFKLNEDFYNDLLETKDSMEWSEQGNMAVPPGSTMGVPTDDDEWSIVR